MNKFLLTILSVFVLTFGNAQVNIDPQTVTLNALYTSFDSEEHFEVQNNGTSLINLFWEFSLSSDTPPEWEVWLCDLNLCYTAFITRCPANDPNVMGAGATGDFIAHMRPNGVVGTGTMTIDLIVDTPFADSIVASIDVELVSSMSTSTLDLTEVQELSIYPNPTVENFAVKNDDNVSTVVLYNIVGKKLKKYAHTPGNQYDISALRKGMYLVRLFDEQGKALSALRLSKK